MSQLHIIIVGILGKFGTRLAKQFSENCWTVSGIDIISLDEELHRQPNYGYFQVAETPALTLPHEITALIQRADIVLLATPLNSTPALISLYGKHLPAGALLVDIASVKTPTTMSMIELKRDDIELLSIHPLFAPEVDFAGENVAAVEIRGGRRTHEFLKVFADWGCRITKLSASEHDHKMAFVQSLCHALIITLGQTGKVEDFTHSTNADLTTPFSRTFLQMVRKLGRADSELYAAIQILNPYTLTILDEYLSQLQEFRSLVAHRNIDEVREYIIQSTSLP